MQKSKRAATISLIAASARQDTPSWEFAGCWWEGGLATSVVVVMVVVTRGRQRERERRRGRERWTINGPVGITPWLWLLLLLLLWSN